MDGKKHRVGSLLWHTLLPVALLAASFAALFLYHGNTAEKAQASLFLSRRALAVQNAMSVRAALEGVSDGLAALAVSAASPDPGVLAAAAEALGLETVLSADAEGLATDGAGAVFSISEAAFFQAALSGETVLLPGGDVFPSDVLVAAVPRRGTDGSFAGVVAGVLGPSLLRRALAEAPYPDGVASLLCDASGRILAMTGGTDGLAQGGSLFSALSGARLLAESAAAGTAADFAAGTDGLLHYVLAGEDRYAVYAPLGAGGWMVVSILPGAALSPALEAAAGGSSVPLILAAALSLLAPVFILCLSARRRRQLEAEKALLESSDRRFRLALQNTTITIRDYDHATHTLTRVGGSSADPADRLIPRVPEDIGASGEVHPDDVETCLAMYRVLLSGAPRAEAVFRVRVPGLENWAYERVVYTNLFDENGRPFRSIGLSEDVTERYEERRRYEQELAFQQLIAREVYATAAVNVTRRRVSRLGGAARSAVPELPGANVAALFRWGAAAVAEDEDVRRFYRTLTPEGLEERFRLGQTSVHFEYLRRFPDGETRWVRDETHLLRDPDTGDLMAFNLLQDITEEKQRTRALEHAAETDAMTGLYTHDAVLGHIARYLEMEGRAGTHALFMLDIDDFKTVNDTFGHAAGDGCILAVVSRARRLFRARDILGRLGGDEFLILTKNVQSGEAVRRRARELVQTLRFSFAGPDGRPIPLSVSVGAALIKPGAVPDIAALHARIDAAMYRAKRAGKARYYMDGDDTPGTPDAPAADEGPDGTAAPVSAAGAVPAEPRD